MQSWFWKHWGVGGLRSVRSSPLLLSMRVSVCLRGVATISCLLAVEPCWHDNMADGRGVQQANMALAFRDKWGLEWQLRGATSCMDLFWWQLQTTTHSHSVQKPSWGKPRAAGVCFLFCRLCFLTQYKHIRNAPRGILYWAEYKYLHSRLMDTKYSLILLNIQ